jgi:RNAse (barnase) inhibitor barstar
MREYLISKLFNLKDVLNLNLGIWLLLTIKINLLLRIAFFNFSKALNFIHSYKFKLNKC